jgi:hypothetical protein
MRHARLPDMAALVTGAVFVPWSRLADTAPFFPFPPQSFIVELSAPNINEC